MSVHIAVHQLVTNSDDRRVVVAHQLWLYRPRDPGGGHCWAGLASPQTPPVSTEAAPSCPSRAHRHPRTHPQGTHPWPSNTPSRNTTMAIKRKKLTKIVQRVKLYQKSSQTTSTSALRAVRMVTSSRTPQYYQDGQTCPLCACQGHRNPIQYVKIRQYHRRKHILLVVGNMWGEMNFTIFLCATEGQGWLWGSKEAAE